MTKEIPSIKNVVLSVIPLILIYYVSIWTTGQFMIALAEMLEDGVPWTTRIIFQPYFTVLVLSWAAVILGLAVALPTKRRILWHVSLWSGLISIVFFFIGVFIPMVSVINSLSAGQ